MSAARSHDSPNQIAFFNSGDYANAISLMTPLADAGDVRAQSTLAHMYTYGEGTPIDFERMLHYARLAAEQGDCDAMMSMFFAYSTGQGVSVDASQAREWVETAYNHHCTRAPTYLGMAYLNGLGMKADPIQALKFFTEGAEQGDDEAQLRLGLMLTNPPTTAQRIAEGINWLRRSAEQRSILASLMIGMRYVTGTVREIPLVEATLHAQLAMEGGCKVAAEVFAALQPRLSDAQNEQLLKDRQAFDAAHPKRPKHKHEEYGPVCDIPFSQG